MARGTISTRDPKFIDLTAISGLEKDGEKTFTSEKLDC